MVGWIEASLRMPQGTVLENKSVYYYCEPYLNCISQLNEWNPKSSSLLEITEDILATVGFIKFNVHMKSKF